MKAGFYMDSAGYLWQVFEDGNSEFYSHSCGVWMDGEHEIHILKSEDFIDGLA